MVRVKCPHCLKKFTNAFSKNRHLRKVHSIEVEMKNRNKHILCPLCLDDKRDSFVTYQLLMQHIGDVHNIIVKQEKINFSNYEEFERWRMQDKRDVNYLKEKLFQSFDKKIIYYKCNRSNTYGFQSNCTKRMMKKGGSIKINGVCPSRITAYCSNNGEVEVNFVETHVGHTMDFRSERLTNEQQEYIGKQLKAGVPKERIIKDAREIYGSESERIKFINNQDLMNLSRKLNIEKRRDPDDIISKQKALGKKKENYAMLREIKLQRAHSMLDDTKNLNDETFDKAMSELLPILKKYSEESCSKRKEMDKQTCSPQQKKQRTQ